MFDENKHDLVTLLRPKIQSEVLDFRRRKHEAFLKARNFLTEDDIFPLLGCPSDLEDPFFPELYDFENRCYASTPKFRTEPGEGKALAYALKAEPRRLYRSFVDLSYIESYEPIIEVVYFAGLEGEDIIYYVNKEETL